MTKINSSDYKYFFFVQFKFLFNSIPKTIESIRKNINIMYDTRHCAKKLYYVKYNL